MNAITDLRRSASPSERNQDEDIPSSPFSIGGQGQTVQKVMAHSPQLYTESLHSINSQPYAASHLRNQSVLIAPFWYFSDCCFSSVSSHVSQRWR